MNIDHQKLRYISGPISVVKIEGVINNIKKEILIFGDVHLVEIQNECESLESVPIKNYLIDLFKNSNENIDFFLEIDKSQMNNKQEISFTDNYISQLVHFFKKNNKNFNKVRFHYSDIRDVQKNEFLKFVYMTNQSKYSEITDNKGITYDDLLHLLYISDEIKDYVNIIIKGLKSNPKSFKRLLNDEPDDSHKFAFIKNIYKILNKYNNESIKIEIRKILKILTSNVLNDVDELIKFIRPIKKKIEDNKHFSLNEIDKNVFDLVKKIDKIASKISGLFAILTDIYTIRRILDKNYIEKSIIYVGGAHSRNLINLLINNFRFKIVSKFSQENILIKIDKKYVHNYFKIIYKQSFDSKKHYSNYLRSHIPKQCIDIGKFKKPLI